LCHLYGDIHHCAIRTVPHTTVPSVRCHTPLCHLYGAIHHCAICTVPYTTVPLFSLAVNCLVCQSTPFCCLPFCYTQFLTSSTHPNTKPTHFRKTYCCPQNGAQFLYGGSFSVVYSKMINRAANCFYNKITNG